MKHKVNKRFSIPKSSFISGAGSALGIGGNYFKFDKPSTHVLSDSNALHSDWQTVGKDISSSMNSSKAAAAHGKQNGGWYSAGL